MDPDARHPIDVRRLRQALVDLGAGAVFRELIGVFLHETPERLTALRRAASAGDARGVKSVAHTIKGSCGYLGATGLVALCRELELLSQSGAVAAAGPVLEQIDAEFQRVQAALERELETRG
jgi:HPt (histidine-containing phosphotransfer) domain-containing protein